VALASPALALNASQKLMLFGPAPAISAYHQILAPSIPVASFGAVGDGSTDDWLSIQAALNAAGAAGGGTVTFAAGTTYYVSRSLCVPSNVTAMGAGPTSVITGRAGASGSLADGCSKNGGKRYGNFVMIGATNASVQNLKIDNQAHATHANGISMVPDGAGNVTKFSYVGGNTVVGNPDHEYLVWNLAGQHNVIAGNTIIGNSPALGAPNEQEGIESYGGHFVTIAGNTVSGVGTDAILVWQDDEDAVMDTSLGDVSVTGNTVSTAYNGISVEAEYGATNIAVAGNAVDVTWNAAISYASETSGFFNDAVVTGNTITNETSNGIRTIAAGTLPWSNAVVSANAVAATSFSTGVSALSSSAPDVLWSGNTVSGGTYTVADGTSTNNVYTGNTVSGWLNAPYYLPGVNTALIGEHVLMSDASTPALTLTFGSSLLSSSAPSTTVTVSLWETLPGFGAGNLVLPAGVACGPLTSLDGGLTWTGTITQTGVTGSGLISVNLSGAWASSGSVSGVLSNVAWISYGGAPAYTPRNYLQHPEPVVATDFNGDANSCNNCTQASFSENGLTNGVHWDGSTSTPANAYFTTYSAWPLQPNTDYTISAYFVRDDGGVVTGLPFYWRVGAGPYGTSVGFGMPNCSLVSGALYRCWQAFNTGAAGVNQYSNGVGRVANPGNVAIRFTGLMINPGTTPAAYSASP
jgi:hypothetical protein